MNRVLQNPSQTSDAEKQKVVEPLRQVGMGPALLAAYVLLLAVLQFTLVTLGNKPFLGSC